MNSPAHITRFRDGFPPGFTAVTEEGERECDTGMDLGFWKLKAGDTISETHPKESAWLLLGGEVEVEAGGIRSRLSRRSLFEEQPTALHVGPSTPVCIKALGDVEWALMRAENSRRFEPKLFLPEGLESEYRGKGLVQEAALRNVRLIFDWNNRPQANLVLGEVVNYPGRWSSYPPHTHPQAEIYHYRFTEPQGYGHGELGEEVYKVRQRDTLKILNCVGHAQVAAPGYGMWYLWVVRHLKDNPYRGFKFLPEHEWTLDPKKQGWRPPL